METRIAELRYKEVISVEDGSRFGYVGDMEVDRTLGRYEPCRPRPPPLLWAARPRGG